MSEVQKLFVSVEEAGEILGISRGMAYQLARKGTLPGVKKLGGRFLVSLPALQEYAREPAALGARQ